MRDWIELSSFDLSRPLPPVSIISGKPATVTWSRTARHVTPNEKPPGAMFGMLGVLVMSIVGLVTGGGKRRWEAARAKDRQIELPMTSGERTRCRIRHVIKSVGTNITLAATPFLFYHGFWWAGQDGKRAFDTKGWPEIPGGIRGIGSIAGVGVLLLLLSIGSTNYRYVNGRFTLLANRAFIAALEAGRPGSLLAAGGAVAGWNTPTPAAPVPSWGGGAPPWAAAAPPPWAGPPQQPGWSPPATPSANPSPWEPPPQHG